MGDSLIEYVEIPDSICRKPSYEVEKNNGGTFVILSKAKNLYEDDAFLGDSSLRSE